MSELAEAVVNGADADKLAALPLPPTYRAAYLRRDEVDMFAGHTDKDVRRSLHVGEVPMPDPAPDEAVIAVMAAGINYNTVWSAMFEPLPTFDFLARLGGEGAWGARHDLPRHVIGSDASGVVVRVGTGVRRWSVGDQVVVSPLHVDEQEPAVQDDAMLATAQRAWGFETNFGALGHFALVKASQLLPKPAHLTWEEAACTTLCAATAYRMLVSPHGARMKQGDVVLIWGATGGLGGFASQLVRNGGGIAVGVVSSPEKARVARELGCEVVLDRTELGLTGPDLGGPDGWRRLGRAVRQGAGEDPHIVFDYVGRQTFGASVYVARRGGAVVTCGSSSGYEHVYDNRHLWMRLKRIVGSHGANQQEAWETNRLIERGMLVPTLSRVFPLEHAAEATRRVQLNEHLGKVGVLCLAPREGLGVVDHELRERVGEDRLRLLRGPVGAAGGGAVVSPACPPPPRG